MPLTQQHRRGASTVLLVIALACGIDASSDHGNDALVPVPTKPGAPSGPPVSDTITPEGGTLSAADGAISISFPAGAVASPTEFTITPITNTARGAVAGAFRLGPEGTSFAAPVTITFKGPEQYPIGTSIDNVGVESQDRNGFWMKVEPATRDLGANTISVKTTHFSDWTVTWQTGEPLADGPIRLAQNLNVPFDAQGRATVYLRDESTSLTTYVMAGTLTVPATITLGTETCVPDQTTKSWANAAEIDKVRSVFRWGTGVGWTLTCTGTDGGVTTRFMPAVFDTMGINLARCAGIFDPGQYAEKDFIRGAYTADCGAEGGVRGTWDLRGHQVLVNPTSGLVTTEAGGTATFDVVLNKPPAADVVVGLSSSDTTEGTVSSPSITFTPSNWSTPQVVTVTGANDWIDDDDVAYTVVTAPATSTDPRYHGIDPADVEFTNTDDDTAGLAPTPTTGLVTTEAGGTATFQLTLTSEPLADVVVALTSSDTTEGTVTASVTFTPANWNVAQTVTVTGVNDFVDEGDIGYSIALSSSSADPKYVGLTGTVSATNTDDDTAELLPSPSTGLVTTEPDGTTTFSLTLGSEPLADVVVALASSDTTEGTVAPATVTFTATNWNVVQTVTVAAKDDFVADGPIAYAVNLTATSSDPLYNGLTKAASLTNADNDVAGFAASPSTDLVTTEKGGATSFGLALTSEPLADVVVALASSDTTEGTVAPATVTFTAANWNVAQTVTVTGVDDAVADGLIAYAVNLSGTSTDSGYGGRTGSVAIANGDDDVAGIAVGTPSTPSTSEVGGAATFTVVLTSQPTSDVTVPITSSDTTEGTVAPAPLVFTATNWNVAQTVTVTGVDDFVADGDQTYLAAIGPATSADLGYAGRDPEDLTFTNIDEDVAGIAVGAPSAPSTSETGTSATFTVMLTSQPTSDVTIPVISSDTTEGAVAPASLVFTASNWSAAQTVTVTGVNDAVDDGDQTYLAAIGPATSADLGYADRDPADLTFTNTDDDVAGLVASPSTGLVTTEAGGTTSFQLTLASQPTADVAVAVSSSDPTEGTVAPATVTFTAANWDVAQTVTVIGVDDAVADGEVAYTVNLSATSSDPGYGGRTGTVSVTNSNDDAAGIAVSAPSGLYTSEARNSVTFTVALTSQPTSDVTVPIASSDTTEGTVAPAPLVFTAANWNEAQTVTVTGVDDVLDDGDQLFTALVGPSSSPGDPGYSGIDPGDIALTNTDDDTAGLVASPSTGLVTNEAAGTASFQVTLSSQPLADVVVALSSSDPTEGTVAPASVTFTPANWNVAQTVTVTGADDAVADGAIEYAVNLSATSTGDGLYNGAVGTVAVTNDDNDAAGLVASPSNGLTTTEAGGTASFQVTLSSQPVADVVVALASGDTTEGTVAPATVTFTAANWNVAQTVTVTGADDASVDGPIAYAVNLSATSTDAQYTGRTGTVSVTNNDNDEAGLVATPSTGLVTSEPAVAASFQLKLSSQPSADVVIALSSSDTTEGTVAPASVTFTAANWNQAQTVTVTGVDDAVADGAIAYTVSLSATSSDAQYTGLTGTISLTNGDDDAAGIAVGTPSATTTSEAGAFATFTVVLTSQPTSDVTVPVTSSDTTEGAVAPASLVFTTTNWNEAQTVTVTGVDDAAADGTQTYLAVIGTTTSADSGYAGKDPADLTFTNADNDVVGLAATPSTGLVTTEAGGAASFQLALTSQPSADVVVAVSSSDPTEGTVSPATVTFTTANWNAAQTVAVTGVDDAVADGAVGYSVNLSATSSDPGYSGRTGSVSVSNDDNDAAGIAVGTPSATSTSETRTSATFTVVLTSQPTADVTVPVSSSDTSEGTVAPASLVFTAANWNVAQTVTVTGVDDAAVDGNQTYLAAIGPATSADLGYAGRDPADLTFTNTDNDVAGLVASPSTGLGTSEGGGAASFQLSLSSQPSADVVVAVSSSDTTEGTVSPATVTFTTANWNVAQTVTVTGVDDALADGAIGYAVNLSATSTDPGYGGRTGSVSATNDDNDAAGITVGTPSATTTSETATFATFTVVLASQPTSDVTVPVSSSDTTEGAVAPASLVFTATNWNVAQTVTVTGVDDAAVDGDQTYLAAIGPATSADLVYAGRDPADLTFTNTDNDAAGLVASPSTGLTTTEAGGTASFQLTLSSQPSANVVVAVSSSDSTEGTVAPASMTFTAANWNQAQTVTVTGVDDAVADGLIAYAVNLSATSSDALYSGRTGTVSVTNGDDDAAGIAVSAPSDLSTSEAGLQVTFTVVLASQPTSDVTIPITSSDTSEGTVAPAPLVFTAANWDVAQTVTVTGVDDAVDDGDQFFDVLVGASSSADPTYNAVDPGDIALTNTDDDTAALVASPSTGLGTTEAGGAASFQLTLASEPTGDVVVALSSSDPTEGTVAPATVTFTTANWNVTQTVTVIGVDDASVDGAIAYAVNLSATSTDALYGGKTGAVSVTNGDNDMAGIAVGTPSATSTSETGTSATFTVVLTSQPASDVTVPVSSTDPTEGTVAPASLVFTAANWSVAQTVTVTGVDDPAVDGNQTYQVAIGPATSTDAGYAGSNPADLTFTNTDDDAAGLVASPSTGLTTTEAGGTASFQLTLASQPSANVVVALSSSDTTEGSVAPATVTFTAANWNQAQTVTVTGVDDASVDGAIAYAVNLSATSTDTLYSGAVGTVSVTNGDNDAAGITVGTPSATTTSEAVTFATFTVVLTSQPSSDVTVPVSSSDTTEGTVAPASLVFTSANWSVAQTVTVAGVDDAAVDGDQTYLAAIGPATSGDSGYAGRDPADLTFTNTDNDAAGLVPSPSTGLVTSEPAGTASFQLTLSSQPTGDVVVALSTSDPTEGTVAPTSVTFTTANWNQAQTVTVTGVDDAQVDGAIAYTVNLSATSTDGQYTGRTGTVSVTNNDNDAAGITVGTPSATTTSEAGTSATFTVVLASQPSSDVTVPVSSSDTTEGTVAPSSLVFTSANWDVAQTVTVTGVNDAAVDGDQTYLAAIGPATSADSGYAGRDPADLTFTNTDNDAAGLVASPSTGLGTTEAGGTASFQLTLSSQPSADVVVAVSSSDPTEGTVAPATMTFTAANWNAAQTVTVTGADDAAADGTVGYSVNLSATSTDTNYNGRTGAVSVTNSDNDTAAIAVGTPSATSTSEAGTSATFTVVLTSQPTANVTVPVSSSDTSEGTVAPASLVFTTTNWNAAQTVTVTGVDDAAVDGNQSYQAVLGPATSADAGYAGSNPADLTFTNTDNDLAGLVASPSTGLTTSEPAGTASFQLALSSQPSGDVVVALTSSDTTEGTVAPATVTFTTANWDAAQTVTVTGVDDAVVDGAIAYTVNLSATSTDAGYDGRGSSVSVTNGDNDAVGIAVGTPSATSTSEAGTSATFTVVLSSQPTADVTVPVSSTDTSEGTVAPASLVFTTTNWNAAQTVTVTGADDALDDGDQTYQAVIGPAISSDSGYSGNNPADLTFTNTDNDAAGLVASPSTGLTTTEAGGAATFQLKLSSQPGADVVVGLSISDPTEGTVAPATVTFTSANWSTAQTVTVTGVDDAVADGVIAYAVNLSATSADTNYHLRTAAVSVTNGDDDAAGIVVSAPSGMSTSETGLQVTFTVVLASQPTQNVTVPITPSDTSEGAVSPAPLVFTAANWNVAQTVTVTGVDDALDDGDQLFTVLVGASTSADLGYDGIDPGDIALTNTDNDAAAIVASPSTGLTTTEAGGTASFQVTLTSEPLANVVVALSSTDATEGTVAPATVTFTSANWSLAQTVTVTGVDDASVDGAIAYAVNLSATSSDPGYNGRTGSVSASNGDNDTAGIAVGAPSATTTSEAGAFATFTVVLTSEPTSDVTVPVSSSDPTEGTVSPASLVFTAANWNVAQTVTVTGVNDAVDDGDQTFQAAIGPATSADLGYDGRDPADLTFTNTDNDTAGITVGAPSATTTSETGASATFTVVLTSEPTADVTVPVSSSDPTEGTVSPASLVFTAANWNVAQTVTVTGVNDAVDDGDQSYQAAIGPATSADLGYTGRDPADLTFTNTDNDAAGIAVGTPSATTTSETGTSATFTVVLTSQPTADVTVPVSSSDTMEGTVAPASLVFTSGNWNVAQTVTVTGVDDVLDDGDQTYLAAIGPATSADAGYTGNNPADLTFTNTDNDAAELVASPSTGLVTSEAGGAGGAASFQLTLSSQPSADVVVALASSDPTEGTVAPTSVTFTAANWNVAQPVTVTGADDAVADGTIAYAVNLSATSTDPGYGGRTGTVSVTNGDDDTAGVAVSGPSGLFTSEAGLQVTFTVVLASEPTSDVTVPITSGDPTEGTVAPAPLVFTATNWNVAQTVTVTGVDDLVDDGDLLFDVLVGAATSADPSYGGVDPDDIVLTNTDDDAAGQLMASPSTGLVTSEPAVAASFQLTLSSPPSADVVVALVSSDPTEGTVAPASLVFTSGNWNVAQTVTVTGADDALADGPVAYAVNLSATSADPLYSVATGAVSVTNSDDDGGAAPLALK